MFSGRNGFQIHLSTRQKETSIVNIKDQEHKSMNNEHKSMVNNKILKEKDEYKRINGVNVVKILNKLSILNENIK